jgi:integrase
VALKPEKLLPKVSKRRQVSPFTKEEVSIFLAAQRHAARYYPLFLCAVRTGLRLGELLALQWGDLDFQGHFLLVQRNYTHGKVTAPKSGEVRRVDISGALGPGAGRPSASSGNSRPRPTDGPMSPNGCSVAKQAA